MLHVVCCLLLVGLMRVVVCCFVCIVRCVLFVRWLSLLFGVCSLSCVVCGALCFALLHVVVCLPLCCLFLFV